MIDPNKKYRTRSGNSVFGIRIVPKNSADKLVTFPVKGSIDMGPRKQPRFQIWKMDGRADLFSISNDDLIEGG